ncbi:MAG TPA: peptidoglycan DD-metalloendopeptidase family protein [Bacillales bacterium]|nr:peptidoglycan DD-metalloendopeptidase family protein [Bacillales bacterium]
MESRMKYVAGMVISSVGLSSILIIFLCLFFILMIPVLLISKDIFEPTQYNQQQLTMIIPPSEYREIYENAAKEYGVDWYVLAAIHYVETSYSTSKSMVSSAGALGHTQFMLCTWVGWSYSGCKGSKGNASIPASIYTSPRVIAQYGGYGRDANKDGKADPFDIEDAIYSTAYYLSKNGYKNDKEKAIYQYNHADWYVNKVMDYAEILGATADLNGKWIWPAPTLSVISSDYGWRNLKSRGRDFHDGIDIVGANTEHAPVYAIGDGIVTKAGKAQGFGEAVYIDHGNGMVSRYGHLQYNGYAVRAGDVVKKGQLIGAVGAGRVGSSEGPHLHLDIKVKGRFIDPLTVLSPR